MTHKAQGTICSQSYEEYLEKAKAFHGFAAPGIAIGGFMMELALRLMHKEERFSALCETSKCLPDAVSLLSSCTVGNGRLLVADVGRYALILYNRETGKGVRVYIDPAKLDAWPEFKSWFFKLKPKKEQDYDLLMKEIKEVGVDACSTQHVVVDAKLRTKNIRSGFAICPRCKESYPADDGRLCRGCSGDTPLYTAE